MLAILSPAKSLDFDSPAKTRKHSVPSFVAESTQLIEKLRTLSAAEVGRLMGLSEKLAALNHERYARWSPEFEPTVAKQAILAFRGDVYRGIQAADFDDRDFSFAQKHVRILSGLHGVLKPLDLIHPYRLEMGTSLATERGKNLYAFWGRKVTDALNAALAEQRSKVLVNLASNEYYGVVQPDAIDARIVNVSFKDWKNGKHKIISFFAKRARGLMTGYIVRERVKTLKALRDFRGGGYYFSEEQSQGDDWVFLRDEATAA